MMTRLFRAGADATNSRDVQSGCGFNGRGSHWSATDWLLSDQTSGSLSFLWTVCAYTLGSGAILLVSIPLSRLSRYLSPAGIWCWAWLGLYTLMLVNVDLLPRLSFVTLPSIALTVSLCLAAGVVSWLLGILERRAAHIAGCAALHPGYATTNRPFSHRYPDEDP